MNRKLHLWAFTGPMAVALLALALAGPAEGQTNQKPIADVTATPTSASVRAVIYFDGIASADPDGTIATFTWDFGDGTPVVSGTRLEAEEIFHSFGSTGTYTVTLTVTDDGGLDSDPTAPTSTVAITIGAGTTTTTTAPSVDGAGLFSSTCSACHSKADLAGRGLTNADLVTVMTSGLMKAQASSLGSTQIQAVADYIVPAGSGGGTTAPPATTTTTAGGTNPPPADGAALFTSTCSACHTKANLAGRGLSSADLVAVMTSGLMKTQASSLSSTQIQAVAKYIVPAGSGGGTATTTTTAPGGTVSGSAVYSSKCAACHGGSGQGGIGPSLQTSTWTKSATSNAVANGVGSMPGFSSSLSGEEISAVSSYSVRLQSSTATTTTTAAPSANASGGQLYSSQCAACHGASGTGGIGPSLVDSSLTNSATIGAVTNGIGGMPGYAGKLTADQIATVSSYSVGFQTGESTGAVEATTTEVPAGAAGVYDSNCAACHGASGEGGIGPSLQESALDLDGTIAAIANGVGTMPGFSGGLSEQLINDVALYSVAFQSGQTGTAEGGDATADASPGLASEEGAALFSSNCAVCHGALGEGASAAPINVPFANEQLMEIIRVGIADMPGFASALSDDQVVVLADYVHALAAEAAPTTTVPPAETGHIVAIQPSKYVEFDTARTSVPISANARVGLALASIILLGSLAYWEMRKGRVTTDPATGSSD